MKAIRTWISHNQGLFVALVICAGLLVWTLGCESKVTSLVDPVRKVTAAELDLELESESARLEAELDQLVRSAQIKQAELARQDAIKKKLFDFAALSATSGTVNPAGIITLVGSLLGIGAVVDNRIKDKVIKNRPINKSAEV